MKLLVEEKERAIKNLERENERLSMPRSGPPPRGILSHRPSTGEELLGSALNFSPPAVDLAEVLARFEERETQTDDHGLIEELRAELAEQERIAVQREERITEL